MTEHRRVRLGPTWPREEPHFMSGDFALQEIEYSPIEDIRRMNKPYCINEPPPERTAISGFAVYTPRPGSRINDTLDTLSHGLGRVLPNTTSVEMIQPGESIGFATGVYVDEDCEPGERLVRMMWS